MMLRGVITSRPAKLTFGFATDTECPETTPAGVRTKKAVPAGEPLGRTKKETTTATASGDPAPTVANVPRFEVVPEACEARVTSATATRTRPTARRMSPWRHPSVWWDQFPF